MTDTPLTVGVETKALGSRSELLPRFDLPIPGPAGQELTLRKLIDRTVRHEVAAFDERRRARSLPQVLGERELRAAADDGAYRSGARPTAPPPPPDEAVRTAIEGFEDGLYLVLVDGTKREDLDAPLELSANSTVTYLRLVALAGG